MMSVYDCLHSIFCDFTIGFDFLFSLDFFIFFFSAFTTGWAAVVVLRMTSPAFNVSYLIATTEGTAFTGDHGTLAPRDIWFIVTGAIGCITVLLLAVYLCLFHGPACRETFSQFRWRRPRSPEKKRAVHEHTVYEEDAEGKKFYTHAFLARWLPKRNTNIETAWYHVDSLIKLCVLCCVLCVWISHMPQDQDVIHVFNMQSF